ncbi:Protein of unknown function [Bacillus cytotoxicus]|uniref:Uncharacterized protein n=1 Tax=Bacillus cytotoxicus TaxID=580165 RepID=A0AAX2CBQ4_9BACI|nr:Protein of unknown function [Bacillus cytotoxicus]SCN29572.1 Protein of unknown function [Bacillus cytotoxicus]
MYSLYEMWLGATIELAYRKITFL